MGTWYGMAWNQIPTILSLLTPEYQTRMVQQVFHEGNTNAAQWPGMYCWPEGFMRRFHFAGTGVHQIMVAPKLVQIMTSSSGNYVTHIHMVASSTWTARCRASGRTCRAGTARRSASGTAKR